MSERQGRPPAPREGGRPTPARATTAKPAGDRTVLVVARERDTTAHPVIRQLEARGVGVLRLDTGRLPEHGRSTVTCDGAATVGRMQLACGHELRTDEITGVWYRHPEPSASAPELLRLIRAPWVNDPRSNASAAYRPAHLRVAAELGLRTPRTMVTNDPEAARDFAFRCGGRAVVKTVRAPLTEAGRPVSRRPVRPGGSRPAAPHEVRYAPCLLQERVVRHSELRVTVVGSRVFGVEIGSRDSDFEQEDWRRNCHEEFPLRPYPLPAGISDRCLALCRHFGLAFATFDFAVTPDGDHVFLELDPHGEWSWIADLTGLPIAGALADLLAGRPGRRVVTGSQIPVTDGRWGRDGGRDAARAEAVARAGSRQPAGEIRFGAARAAPRGRGPQLRGPRVRDRQAGLPVLGHLLA